LLLQIFIQVVIISVINGMAASIYDYMQFFPTPPWLTIVSQFCWSQAHGL
jgi:hypothetical protein